jgi:diadenosine tetraphosphate (Ap4A) HIT family hydrolase
LNVAEKCEDEALKFFLMETLIHRQVAAARDGRNPSVIGRMRSGWAVLGHWQFISGYSLLLPEPVVPSLNDFSVADRSQFLLDMVALGDALLTVTDAVRINYEILGNGTPALHAHVFPRRLNEPEEFRQKPVWLYPESDFRSVAFDPSRDRALMERIRQYLSDHHQLVG